MPFLHHNSELDSELESLARHIVKRPQLQKKAPAIYTLCIWPYMSLPGAVCYTIPFSLNDCIYSMAMVESQSFVQKPFGLTWFESN